MFYKCLHVFFSPLLCGFKLLMSFKSKINIAFNIGSQNNQNEIFKKFCYAESTDPPGFYERKIGRKFLFTRSMIKPKQ